MALSFSSSDRALATFSESDPVAVERAILEAIYAGEIETRGRCERWYGHAERVQLEQSLWDPELVQVRWDIDCFTRTLGNEKYLFIHVQLSRKNLEDWFKRVDDRQPETLVPQVSKRQRGPAPGTVNRYGEADRALFPELERIMHDDRKTSTAAAKQLAEANRVAGVGTPESRAKRLAARYRREPKN